MSADPKRILIIEDEAHIAEGLRLNLQLQGYRARIALTGADGLQQWEQWSPDLIVLDVMLPGIDGLSVLERIRLRDERIPVLILSAKSSLDDRIKGLALGVDDYLTKPFNLDEFLLRVERLLTRAAWSRPDAAADLQPPGTLPTEVAFGPNHIDFNSARARCCAGEVTLTEQELLLLRLFVNNPGRPLSRDKLQEVGWGYAPRTSSRTVDNFIVRLRKYFEPNPKQPVYFRSLRAVGYVFTPDGKLEK
jgi:DNA-binding response OmpR family regulator